MNCRCQFNKLLVEKVRLGLLLATVLIGFFGQASPLFADESRLLRVGLLLSSESDELFQLPHSISQGIEALERRHNLFFAQRRVLDDSEALDFAHDLGKRGFQLALAIGPRFRELWRELVPLYPSTRFVILDADFEVPGVTTLGFEEHLAAFLLGAQIAEESKHILFFAAVDDPLIRRIHLAFVAGARLADGKAKLEHRFLSSTTTGWHDLGGAQAHLERLLKRSDRTSHLVLALGRMGADLLKTTVLTEWLEQNPDRRVSLIAGQLSAEEMQSLPSQVDLLVKRGDLAIQYVTRLFTEKSLEAGMLSFGLHAGGVEIIEHPLRERQPASNSAQQRIHGIRQSVIAGEIQVPDYFRVF